MSMKHPHGLSGSASELKCPQIQYYTIEMPHNSVIPPDSRAQMVVGGKNGHNGANARLRARCLIEREPVSAGRPS